MVIRLHYVRVHLVVIIKRNLWEATVKEQGGIV